MRKSVPATPPPGIRVGAMQRLAWALGIGIAAFVGLPETISWHTRAVASWDLGVLVYLGLAWWLIARNDAATQGTENAPITLNAGTTYLIVSQETVDMDLFYHHTLDLQTTDVAVVDSSIRGGPPYFADLPGAHCFGPLSFQY